MQSGAPLPRLFTGVRGRGILRSSAKRRSPKFGRGPIRSGGSGPGQNGLENAPPLTYPYGVSDPRKLKEQLGCPTTYGSATSTPTTRRTARARASSFCTRDLRTFEEYVSEFAHHFHVFRPDRRGHGRTPDVEGPITYEQMARDTITFLERVVGGPAYLLGHSDGAIVALLAALKRPDLVRKLVFSSGVFHHDGWAPGAIELDEETLAFFIDYWGAVAPDGREHFWVVKEKLDRMHREEPTLTVDDLGDYPGPALIMVDDRDEEIPIEHTLALREGLPNAQLAVLPGADHGSLDARIVIEFLAGREEEP